MKVSRNIDFEISQLPISEMNIGLPTFVISSNRMIWMNQTP